MRRAETEHLRRRLDRLEGEGGDAAHDPLFADVSAIRPPPPAARTATTLGETLDRFRNDPSRARLTDDAGLKYELPLRALIEIVGEHRPLSTIERLDCSAAFDLIAGCPAHMNKRPEYRTLPTLSAIAARVRELGEPTIAPGTLRNHAHHLSSFFNWCLRKGLLTANPATRMVELKGPVTSSRHPFKVDELNALVAALPRWAGSSPGFRWTPVIAIFCGMRLGEIVTLTTDDVQTLDGVWCFVLRPTDDRRLKTAAAQRVVPVHPQLVELGLLRHVDARRLEGGGRLFPELSGTTQRETVDHFQKRFGRLVAKLFPDASGVSFHSFRHGFRDALREAGAPIDATRALGGWARSGGLEERYGQGARPSTLARWMAQVAYPGLVLSPLNR